MTQRELTGADYVAMLRRRWVLILVLALAGPPLAYGVSRFLPNRYKSQTVVLVQPPSISSELVPDVNATSVNGRLATMQQQILSRSRLEPIIHQFGLYSADINRIPMEDLVSRLQKAIDVTPVLPMAETGARDLPGFSIEVTWDDPRVAQEICTTVTSMFIEEDLSMQTRYSDQTTQFLSQQLADSKANLDAEDAKLAAFELQHFGTLPDEEQTNMNVLTGLTSQLDSANQAITRAQQDKSFAESMLAQQLASWQTAQNGDNPESLQQQIGAMQTQLQSLETKYTDDYPDVIKTKAAIAALQQKLAESDDAKVTTDSKRTSKPTGEPAQITQLREQIHSIEQTIAEKTSEQEKIKQQIGLYQGRVQSSPLVEQEYKQLTRGYQTALDSYNDLLKKQGAASMSGALNRDQQGEQFTVLDPASLPNKPSFPNRPLFAVGGLGGGLALGIVLALLLETQDTSFRTERDVEIALGLPVLAILPTVDPLAGRKRNKASSGQPRLGLSTGA